MARYLHLLHSCLLVLFTGSVIAQKFEGEVCEAGPGLLGRCMRVESCGSALADIRNGRKPVVCSYVKQMPIVCCGDPNIVSSPPQVMPVWTEEESAASQRPPPPQTFGDQQPPSVQVQNQRPLPGQSQRPSIPQGPNQQPFGGQRPNQQPFGGQRPNQQPSGSQRPPVGPGQNGQSFGGGQGPNQRPQLPFGGQGQPPAPTAAPPQPPVQSSGSGRPTQRPWWKIPDRKTSESPAVIDNPATLPMRVR